MMEKPRSALSPRNSGADGVLRIGMPKRAVSFSDMVNIAEAYGDSEYKRNGYKNRNKKYWFFEKDRHDSDDRYVHV